MATFLRRVSGLGVATAGAQFAAAVNLVIVARLLPQSDVGHYTVFISYAMILLPISLLSYEVLLPNLEERELSLLLKGIIPVACCVALMVWGGFSLAGYRFSETLSGLLLSMALLRLVEFAGIRAQRVSLIALARVAPHTMLLGALGFLWAFRTPTLESVIGIHTVAFALPALLLGAKVLVPRLVERTPWRSTVGLLMSRWRNPLIFAPSEIASTAAWNLPVVLIERGFGPAMAAQFGVMLRYVMAPVGLINSVIGNVYHADLARSVRERTGGAYERFRFMHKRMLLIGVMAGVATAAVLPPVLRLLLGPGWELAETLTVIMAPLVAVAVWSSPFGVAFYVFERPLELLMLNLSYVAIAVAVFGTMTGDLQVATALFALLAGVRFLVLMSRVNSMIGITEKR